MDPDITLAIALAEARSCLAALADSARSFEEASGFERMLIALDEVHPHGPAIYTINESAESLFRRLSFSLLVVLATSG